MKLISNLIFDNELLTLNFAYKDGNLRFVNLTGPKAQCEKLPKDILDREIDDIQKLIQCWDGRGTPPIGLETII